MKELDTRNEFFNDADPELIDKFEQSWVANSPLEISECLPPENDSRYRGTLEELAHIDREFRWKSHTQEADKKLRPLETYWQTYPALAEFKLSLIQGEFELAHRFSSETSIDDFVERFGETIDGQELRPILERRLQQWKLIQPVRPGSTLGRYEIVNEHGRGGFGAVWRAKDTQLGRRIAVKQLGQRLANDAESRRRFISEARVTARLEHPGIVPVYDISNVEEDHAYYTMRLIQGRTMAEAIDHLFESDVSSDEFRLKRRKLLQSFIDACRTIEYAHAQGVIHRDIKPHNVIVGDYGETILLDWGLASVTQDGESLPEEENESIASDPEILTQGESVQTLQGNAVGTPAYMPPEQAKGELESIGIRSDIYSLGTTLYHLVTGKVPFSDKPLAQIMERVRSGELPPANKIQTAVEKPLSAIVTKATATSIDDRYSNVGEMADDIQRFLADQPVSVYRDPFWGRVSRSIRKNPTTTAVLGIWSIVLVAAIATGWVIRNAWQLREANRISNLQIAAERADGTALSQITSNRFGEAVQSLQQARILIENEPTLSDLDAKLAGRLMRTNQILNFYRLGSQGQEYTFLDQTDNAALFCQAAVNELKILENPDWWNSLPDEDLSIAQKDELRNEVYRILTLLTAMRMAETAEGTITMSMLFSPDRATDSTKVDSLRAVKFAAQAANRFRPSRAMKLFQQLAEFSLNEIDSIEFGNLSPTNLTDSAVMGSILDNNVSTIAARTAASALLQMQNPNKVAMKWLNDAMKESPDWYWLPVFVGNSQMRMGQYLEAVQSLSHAVGVRPDFWVGYQYRAAAYVYAAQMERRNRKTELLNAASRDIQRALDLQPNHSELYWTLAMIQRMRDYDKDAIAESFLTAFSLHPQVSAIRGGHFTGISREFFGVAQSLVDQPREQQKLSPKLSLLAVVIALWLEDFDKAKKISAEAIANYPDDPELKSMNQLVINRSQSDIQNFIEFNSQSPFSWQYQYFNAELLEKRKEFDEAAFVMEKNLKLARAEWQKTTTRLAYIRCLALNEQRKEAIDWMYKSFQLNQSSDFTELRQLAEENDWNDVRDVCDELLERTSLRTQYDSPDSMTIKNPAILNGDFEMGLSFHWAQFSRRHSETVWNNFGKSNSTATVSQEDPVEGKQCLMLSLNSPMKADSFGWMSQSFPVTAGKKYRVRFQAKSDQTENKGLTVGIAGDEIGEFLESVQLGNGTRDWTSMSFDFVAQDKLVTLAIKGAGSGQAWIDEIRISIVD